MAYNAEEREHIENLLAERAETLLRQRARKLGMSPRTLLNQIVPEEAPTKRTPAQDEHDSVVRTLLQRLKERDG